MSSDPNSWPESKAKVAPGKVWDFRRGYRVHDAGQHELEHHFRAFQIYLNLGAGRSYEAVAEMGGHSIASISKWADRWNWQVRVAAWDKQQLAITFKEASKIERSKHRDQIQQFRKANEEQAKLMMGVSEDLMRIIQKRIEKADAEGEDIPMALVSGLMRAAANISDSGRQAWATSLGVNELMQVVDQELVEVQVSEVDEDVYEIPLDE
jgi:hypothetical protein